MAMEKSSSSSGGGGASRSPKSNKANTKKAADPRTLFVKFHPPSASITRQHLQDHFSNYGPVNRASVIRQRKSKAQQQQAAQAAEEEGEGDEPNYDRGSKGYGFVRFVNEEDAKSAADAIRKKQKTGKRGGGEVMVVEGVRYRMHAERAVDAATASGQSPQKHKSPQNEKEVSRDAGKSKPPKEEGGAMADANKKSSADSDAAYKAESKRKRTSRVIVRNLSFYATSNHVKSAMETNFGPVAVVDLPLVPDLPNNNNKDDESKGKAKNRVPRHRGFAFVTFTNANAARQAVEKGGDVQIKNRPVAIDFSVSKLEHRRMMKEKKEEEEGATESESDSDSDSDGDDGEKVEGGSEDEGSDSESEEDSDSESESDSGSESGEDDEESGKTKEAAEEEDAAEEPKATPEFDSTEAKRTLFLRNVPFDASRHDVFELFRKFGRVQAVYLVKDKRTGVFKGTAFVRFEKEAHCEAAMEASGPGGEEQPNEGGEQFVSSKNIAMGLGQDGASGLTLKGRHIFVDLAVDRTTASSLAVQRDADGKPIKKMVGKDRRNLYLKNEGRVSSSAESALAKEASARHGGSWEDLPPSDRSKRERAFAERSTKLRSPLFFLNPTRISVRNLAKHVDEAALKRLVFDALKVGLGEGLSTPKDAVAHWRAGGELPHSEVMRRATDPALVNPPLDEKNMRGSIPSVYVDRDVTGGKKTADAPSRGFGFVEFTHHAHALAVLRQLNNNPMYSAEFVAGGKHASEMSKQKKGKKGKGKGKADPETGAEFLGEDGKVYVPRLIVEFTVENKVKARQQAEKIAQKKANKIKQRIQKKEEQSAAKDDKKKEQKKGRGALQREKKRARKEAGDEEDDDAPNKKESASKKQKVDGNEAAADKPKKPKMVKPQKKRKSDKDEDALEDMIRSYKSSFARGVEGKLTVADNGSGEASSPQEPKKRSREKVAKKRWFE